MLKIQNISFEKDNKKILNDVNLEFEDGKFYAITGPNGSGKSTLAKVIMGIEKPKCGKIILNDENITDCSICIRSKLGLGFAFQTPVKFKGITVLDILKIAGGESVTYAVARSILQEVGLDADEYINRQINNSLSGGELKRIEIATILAKNPKIAIFDEPEAGIDLWSFNNLIDVFKSLEKKGITCIVISHQERILKMADKVILIENGTISKMADSFEELQIMSKGKEKIYE